jgi:hypothetical protein
VVNFTGTGNVSLASIGKLRSEVKPCEEAVILKTPPVAWNSGANDDPKMVTSASTVPIAIAVSVSADPEPVIADSPVSSPAEEKKCISPPQVHTPVAILLRSQR